MLEFLGGVFLLFINLVIRGYVLSKAWSWIFIKIFPSLPIITGAQAFAISFAISIFLNSSTKKSSDDETFTTILITSILTNIFYLLLIWIIALFV
jgi:hypothetical protein